MGRRQYRHVRVPQTDPVRVMRRRPSGATVARYGIGWGLTLALLFTCGVGPAVVIGLMIIWPCVHATHYRRRYSRQYWERKLRPTTRRDPLHPYDNV